MSSVLTLRFAQAIAVAVFLTLGGFWSVTALFSEGPDEVAHFQFTRYIAKYGHLPTTLEERARAGYKSDWPPLFHLAVGFVGQGIDLDSPPFVKVAQNNPRLQLVVGHKNIIAWRALTTEDPYQSEVLLWYLGRWITLLCGLLGVVAVYLLVRTVYPAHPWLAWGSASLLAFLPAYIRVSGLISYEPLLGALLAFYFLLLYHTLQHPAQSWLYLGLGLLMGLAGLTKHTPLPAIPLLPLLVIWLGYRQQWGWRMTCGRLSLMSLGLFVTVGSWFIYMIAYFNRVAELGWVNGLIYPFLVSDGSDLTSMRIANLVTGGLNDLTIHYNDPIWLWLWHLLTWGDSWATWLLAGLAILALSGLIRQWPKLAERQRLWILLLAGHLGLLMTLPFLRFWLTGQAATGMGQHLLFPAGAIMVLLLLQGLNAWLKPDALVAVLLVIAAIFLGQSISLITRNQSQPWPIQAVPLAAGEQLVAAVNEISLVGYQYKTTGETLDVTLQWRTEKQLAEDYQVELSLLDVQGQPQARWLGQPLNGRYPTRAWTPGDRVRDLIGLPVAGLPDGDYQLKLRVLGELGGIPPQPGTALVEGDTISLGQVRLASTASPAINTVLLGQQYVAYTLWQRGQTTTELPVYRENGTAVFTAHFQTRSPAGEQALQLKLVGSDERVYEPVAQAGNVYDFMVKPDWGNGEYRLRFEQWSGDQLVAQAETEPVLRVETELRRFILDTPISQPLSANFAGYVALLGYDLPQRRVEPGGELPITLHWQALRTIGADLIIFNHLVDKDQKIWGGRDRLAREIYSTMLWAPQEIVADSFTVQVDATAPAGIYDLLVGLYLPVGEASVSLPLSQEGRLTDITHVRIGPIKVGRTPAELTVETVQPQVTLNQPFGAAAELTLLGYDLTDEADQAIDQPKLVLNRSEGSDSALKLTLYWRVEGPLNSDYTTFVHVRNANEIVAQQDQPPLQGVYPTSLWDPGELIADEIVIHPTAEINSGEYTIVIGMYNLNTKERLMISGSPNNELTLASKVIIGN
jgi:hypothetical protein